MTSLRCPYTLQRIASGDSLQKTLGLIARRPPNHDCSYINQLVASCAIQCKSFGQKKSADLERVPGLAEQSNHSTRKAPLSAPYLPRSSNTSEL